MITRQSTSTPTTAARETSRWPRSTSARISCSSSPTTRRACSRARATRRSGGDRSNSSGNCYDRAMKIAVLFGGTSEERDVSIASAAQVIPVLRSLGHDVVAVDTAVGRLEGAAERKLLESRVAPAPPSDQGLANLRSGALTNPATSIDPQQIDVVFLALHGGAGEDGRIQAMLDL